MLDQASTAGVALVTERKATTVSRHREANVTLDVRTMDDGGLRLAPRVNVDGELVDPESVGRLGTPVRGLFYWDGGSSKTARDGKAPPLATRNIHLVPVTEPVGDALRALLDARTPVDVPASGREHFMGNYYPLLRQSMKIGSSDGSAALPPVQDPQLVVTAVHVAAAPATGPVRQSRPSAEGPIPCRPPALPWNCAGSGSTRWEVWPAGAPWSAAGPSTVNRLLKRSC